MWNSCVEKGDLELCENCCLICGTLISQSYMNKVFDFQFNVLCITYI